MIRVLVVLIFSLPPVVAFSQTWIDFDDVVIIDDTVFNKKTGEYYSGLITDHYDDETLKLKVRCSNGLRTGKFETFYSDGTKHIVANFENGKLNGTSYSYSMENAWNQGDPHHCYLKQNFKEGILHGPYESYYSNGNIWQQGTYVAGEETGEHKIFRNNGNLFAFGFVSNGLAMYEWIIFDEDKEIECKVYFNNEGKARSSEGNCDRVFIGSTDIDDVIRWSLELN